MAEPTRPGDQFIDAIGNIGIQSAIGRIELLRIQKVPSGNEPAEYFVDSRLVMSLDTLLRLYQGLGDVVKKLEDRGVLAKPMPAPKKGLKK